MTGGATVSMAPGARSDWLVPIGLLALSFVPVAAGAARVGGLVGGGAITPENARFFADPAPFVLHVIAVSAYCLLGAFQFSPRLRRGGRRWHRAAGRLLVPFGLAAALSGLWMAQAYPHLPNDGVAVYVMRLVVGSAMAIFIVLGVVAIRRRDFMSHGAWMVRGYALGQGAGTQVLTHLPWFILVGQPGPLSRAVLMGAGWIINILLAEWIIRRWLRPRQGG